MKKWLFAIALVVLGVAFAFCGIYVGHMDDAPGAAGIGFALFFVCVFLSRKVFKKYSK